MFRLGFLGEETGILSINNTAYDIRVALMSLSSIGDINVQKVGTSVCRRDDNAIPFSKGREFSAYSYTITFTTLGFPSNTGDIPLINLLLEDSKVRGRVKLLQKSCCSVAVSLNTVDFFGSIRNMTIPFTFDENAVVTRVYPKHGGKNGGTKVRLYGSGFYSQESRQVNCIFGGIPGKMTGDSVSD